MPATTVLQKKFGTPVSAAATITVTPDNNLTSGSVLWVCAWGETTMASASISDGTNTYVSQGSQGYASCWGQNWAVASNSSTGKPTITVTPPANRNMTILLVEVGFVASSSPVDQTGNAWQNWANTDYPAQRPTLGTSLIDDIVLGALSTSPSSPQSRGIGANTGWTQELVVSTGPTTALISKTATSTAVFSPDWTNSFGGSAETTFFGISIKNGAAGGASSFIPRRMMLGVG